FDTVTLAPGTTAALESRTVPKIVPASTWPSIGKAIQKKPITGTHQANIRVRDIARFSSFAVFRERLKHSRPLILEQEHITSQPELSTYRIVQCGVSLNMSQAKKGILLVNDYSHEEFGTAELGRDAGIRPGQPEVNLVPRRSSSHLWFYRGSAEGPAVPALEPR